MNSAAIKSALAEDDQTVFWQTDRYRDYDISHDLSARYSRVYPVRVLALGQKRRTQEWTFRNDGVLIQYLDRSTMEPIVGRTEVVTARTLLGTEADRLEHEQAREVAQAAREAEVHARKAKAETLATLLPQAVKSEAIREVILAGAGDRLEEVFTQANEVSVDIVALDGGAQYLLTSRGSSYHVVEVPPEVVAVWEKSNDGGSWRRQKNMVAGHLITPFGVYGSAPQDSVLATLLLALAVQAGL